MKKSTLLLFALIFAFACFAGEDKDKKNNSTDGFVRTELTDEKSFEVNGLNACQVEADDEEVAEYVPTAIAKK
jgi:hypothetical protein